MATARERGPLTVPVAIDYPARKPLIQGER
jgi:hypothetical protein